MWRFTIPRSLDQIQRELDSAFQPKRKRIKEQKQKLPEKFEAQREGLRAEKESSFNDIMQGARQRGLGFSGIPLHEQSEFTANQFLPAMAEVDQQLSQERQSLQSALDDLRTQQLERAQNLRQTELDREQQQQQFQQEMEQRRKQHQRELELAREKARLSASGGGGGGPSPSFNIPGNTQQGNQQTQPTEKTVDTDDFGTVNRFDHNDGTSILRDPDNNRVVAVSGADGNMQPTSFGQKLKERRQFTSSINDRLGQTSPGNILDRSGIF